MRIVSTKYLEPGAVLGKPVYASDGKILLNSDIVLTSSYINSLKKKNIPSVYIDDDLSKDIEINDVIDHELKKEAINFIKNILNNLSPKNLQKGKDTFVSSESYGDVRKLIYSIMNNLKKNRDSLMNMVEVMSTDLATYTHLVNVAILALLTGRALGLPENKLNDLGTGAIMHDLGRVYIPTEIYDKPGKLTDEEYEQIKQHPIYGYNMVKSNPNISAIVKTIILMHHEKLDGSGYPLGLTGDKLNVYVKIVGICDMFEAMVSHRAYRSKMPVYKALELLSAQTIDKIDSDIYKAFIQNIAIYPIGTGVLLNTGEKGLVIQNNKSIPTRPVVRILISPDGKLYSGFKTIDLMKELTVFIKDTCHIRY